jgi:GntR family transcriptional regulator
LYWSGGVYIGPVAWDDRRDRIDREGPALVWQQVAADIAADIESGVLPAGQRLPSEQVLADDIYAVSRPTIRRAIGALVERGLLTVVHGRGTFVTRPEED